MELPTYMGNDKIDTRQSQKFKLQTNIIFTTSVYKHEGTQREIKKEENFYKIHDVCLSFIKNMSYCTPVLQSPVSMVR